MTKQDKVAFSLWGLILVLACIKAWIMPEFRSVFPHYFNSGVLWNDRVSLYNGGRGFIYLPTFAFLSSIFSFMGLRMAETVWTFVQITLFISGLFYFVKKFRPVDSTSFFLWVTLFALPAAFSSIRNGQANIIMMGIAFWAAISLADKAWGRTAFLLTLGLAIKPTFIVLFLLAGALYPQLWGRLVLGLVVAFFLPMIFASPVYVISQYIEAVHMLGQTFNVGVNESNWANLLNVLPQLTGHYIPHFIQTIIRMVTALGTFLLCLKIKREGSEKGVLLPVFILSFCYLLIFNPRTENNDYVFIGWFYGYVFACALAKRAYLVATGMVSLLIFTIFSANIARLFTEAHSWITPVSVTIFTLFFIIFVCRNPKTVIPFLVSEKCIGRK